MRRLLYLLIMVSTVVLPRPGQASSQASPPDFERLAVYAHSRPSIQSISEVESNLRSGKRPANEELERFLTYDALNHYLAFLLGIIEPLDARYGARFDTLASLWGDDFHSMQRQAQKQAAALARELRFDLALFKNATRQMHNARGLFVAEDGSRRLMQQLEKMSLSLQQAYPQGQGELPPVLIAFARSFFDPEAGEVAVSCRNPLPQVLKERVVGSLDGGEH
ncbi:hypothetical protein [Motiliproteus sediminis]|uniref:hypothetical protein n=1 Tax=Motiliproteus sediminis TaxID=1468178 RepID=UPI001AEF9CB5|nr:hypothetical protein [Motiliproteus sediminis]